MQRGRVPGWSGRWRHLIAPQVLGAVTSAGAEGLSTTLSPSIGMRGHRGSWARARGASASVGNSVQRFMTPISRCLLQKVIFYQSLFTESFAMTE